MVPNEFTLGLVSVEAGTNDNSVVLQYGSSRGPVYTLIDTVMLAVCCLVGLSLKEVKKASGKAGQGVSIL